MAFDVKKNIAMTIASKCAILIFNFLVVVLTARFWGAEGRGIVAMFMADISLLLILTNIFTGSSVSFYLQKSGVSRLFAIAMLWIAITSTLGALLFHILEKENLSLFFFIASAFTGLLAFFNSSFVGNQRIKQYNILTILQPFMLLGFMLLFYYFVDSSYRAYFYALMLSLFILTIACLYLDRKRFSVTKMERLWPVAVRSFKFGFQTELSNFLQFFNYRLSYYFLAYLIGKASVGVFSIGVALAEAIWIVSRSISMVQYSKLLKDKDGVEARRSTVQVARYSLWITMAIILVANLLPGELYAYVFGGEDFADVKTVLMYLSPGVLLIAVSNVFGHYFSAIGKLRILVIKSFVGVLVTLALSYFFITQWKIVGASLVNMSSNVVTSIVLFIAFWMYTRKNEVHPQNDKE